MSEAKTRGEELKESLTLSREHISGSQTEEERRQVMEFCEGYKDFLNRCKTERESVHYAVEKAKEYGYVPFEPGKKYQPGDKVYSVNRGKSMILTTFGTNPLTDGVRIQASHIDSPRLDLKQNPLYEDSEIALLKTHYYGGIKKYQWSAIPLALHGVVVKEDGTVLHVTLGEDAGDPVFCVTDLLPHLGREQMKRTLNEGLKGEELNIIFGSEQLQDEKVSEKVKLNILSLLAEKYGITEEDFTSAELCAVPAFTAKDVGLDRSLIGAYGQDDHVCAYTSLMAELETKNPRYTTVTMLADKEEIGSNGATGLKSNYFYDYICDLAESFGVCHRRVFEHSKCLSADVGAAYDPTFGDVSEKNNCAYLNHGPVLMKYTGAGGKSGTNDCRAEYFAFVRRIFNQAGVPWQTSELGKVDAGGGGTVAMYIAEMNVDTVDIGVAVLSMHAPFELVAKNDVYHTYRAFRAFYE